MRFGSEIINFRIENQMWFFWEVVIAIIQKLGSYSTIWLKFCLSHCKISFIKHRVISQKLYSIKFSLSFYIFNLLRYLLKKIYMVEILLKPFWVLLHCHSWLRLHKHALFYITPPILYLIFRYYGVILFVGLIFSYIAMFSFSPDWYRIEFTLLLILAIVPWFFNISFYSPKLFLTGRQEWGRGIQHWATLCSDDEC